MEELSKYAFFDGRLYTCLGTIPHVRDGSVSAVVLCESPEGERRYATGEEWSRAARAFNEEASAQGLVTAASPASEKLRLFRSLFRGREDVHAHGYRRKDGASPMRRLAPTSGFAVCARNVRMCERSALIARRGRSRC